MDRASPPALDPPHVPLRFADLQRRIADVMEPMPLADQEIPYAQSAREWAAVQAVLHFRAHGPHGPDLDHRTPARELVRLFFSRHEAEIARLDRANATDPRLGCRRGCSTCCHYHVIVTAAEVLDLAGYLQATLKPAALAALTAHVQETAARIRGITAKERWEQKIPCPLLDARGACRGYKHRPIICHGYNGVSAEDCASVLPGEEHTARVDTISLSIGLCRGIGDGTLLAGVDGNALELTLGLEIALTVPDVAARWLRGERVFSPAWIGEPAVDEAAPTAEGACP